MTDRGWPALAESARLAVVVDEQLVWSATDGTIGRAFMRAIHALASTHVEVFVLSQRAPAIVELLQRSTRGATWVAATGSVPASSGHESIRVRLSGVPLIVIREADGGQIVASAVDAALGPRNLAGPMAVLDFLWWIGRHRGVTRGGFDPVRS